MTDRTPTTEQRNITQYKLADLAQLLMAAGWRDTCDAQWTGLEKIAPQLWELLDGVQPPEPAAEPFQQRVGAWMLACFTPSITADKTERNHRFLEEALELVQAGGATKDEALQLVDYVYGRPVGELPQEVGGVAVTLAALCSAHGIDMQDCADTEVTRIWQMVDKIRAKQAAKPKFGPLPGPSPETKGGDV